MYIHIYIYILAFDLSLYSDRSEVDPIVMFISVVMWNRSAQYRQVNSSRKFDAEIVGGRLLPSLRRPWSSELKVAVIIVQICKKYHFIQILDYLEKLFSGHSGLNPAFRVTFKHL